MIHRVFTVYDSKAEAYLAPFYANTAGLALRFFKATLEDPGHDFRKYPGDYTLFEIAVFDDQSGDFETHHAKINLGTALEHLREPKDDFTKFSFKKAITNNQTVGVHE